MTSIKRVLCLVVAFAAVAMLADSAQAEWANGFWRYPYTYFTSKSVCRRPGSEQDGRNGLAISDYKISKLPINQKGINITGTQVKNGPYWAYRWIAIWHCEVSDCWNDPGVHNDFIRIAGSGEKSNLQTTVLLQDLDLHDGNAIPVFIQDLMCDKMTIRDVRINRTTLGVHLGAAVCGYIRTVYIEHCPNLHVALIGRPGSIGTVYIKNSPGIKIGNTASRMGKADAKLVYLD